MPPEFLFPPGRSEYPLSQPWFPTDPIFATSLYWLLTFMGVLFVIGLFWRAAPRYEITAWCVALLVTWFLRSLALSVGDDAPQLAGHSMLIVLGGHLAFLLVLLRGVFFAKGYRQIYAAGISGWFLLVLATVMQIPLEPSREQARRHQCKNNLKFVGMGLYNYYIRNDYLPASQTLVDKDGPRQSWRVAILPFIDQGPLYNEYRIDLPWDSPENQKLLARRPSVLACPSRPETDAERQFSAYFVPTGRGTWTALGAKPQPEKFKDGTSQTILAIENCGSRIPWTEPRDIELTPQSLGINLPGPERGLSGGIAASYHRGRAHVLFADGRVMSISEDISPDVLRSAFDPSDAPISEESF